MLEKYVISIYGKDDAHKIMQEIAPMEKLVFNGHIPSLTNISSSTNTPSLRQTRSSSQTNIAIAAANECMDKIKYVSNSTRAPKKEDKKEDKKLSKKEYLEVIAAADTVGAFLGIAIASGPAAIAASAAAALYYDVE